MITAAHETSTSSSICCARAAARAARRIVFPESADPRVRAAVEVLARERIVEPVVVLDPAAPDTHAAVHALGVETVDPTTDPRLARTTADILRGAKEKGAVGSERGTARHASAVFRRCARAPRRGRWLRRWLRVHDRRRAARRAVARRSGARRADGLQRVLHGHGAISWRSVRGAHVHRLRGRAVPDGRSARRHRHRGRG